MDHDASSAAQDESNTELVSGLCVLERESCVDDGTGCVFSAGWLLSRRLFLKLVVADVEGEWCCCCWWRFGRFVPDSDGKEGAAVVALDADDGQVTSSAAACCCSVVLMGLVVVDVGVVVVIAFASRVASAARRLSGEADMFLFGC